MKEKRFNISEKEIVQFKKRRYVRLMVQNAIKKGDIIRAKTCELCHGNSGGIESHHVDYGKPFDVKWLCSKCHGLAHKKNHYLNPDNNTQTPLPACLDRNDNVSIAVIIPTTTYLALKNNADKENKSISLLVREQIMKKYPIDNGQLEFKFEEKKNDLSQNVRHERIQSLAKDEKHVLPSISTYLQKIRSERDSHFIKLDGFPPIFKRYGRTSTRM